MNFQTCLAATPEEVLKSMQKATMVVLADYKTGGTSALVGEVQDCYRRVPAQNFYCIYLDLAARHVVQIQPEKNLTPNASYFRDEIASNRVNNTLSEEKMDAEEAERYVNMVTSLINKIVDSSI